MSVQPDTSERDDLRPRLAEVHASVDRWRAARDRALAQMDAELVALTEFAKFGGDQ